MLINSEIAPVGIFDQQKKTKTALTLIIIGVLAGFFLLFLLTPKISANNSANITAQEIIYLTNQQRIERHLPALSPNIKLTAAAQKKAGALIAEQIFSHDLPDGRKFSSWVRDEDYAYTIVGENLALGFNTGAGIVNAWMASDTHRKNILMPAYQEIGVAIIKAKFEGQEANIIVEYFGATHNAMISEILLPYPHNLIDLPQLLFKV